MRFTHQLQPTMHWQHLNPQPRLPTTLPTVLTNLDETHHGFDKDHLDTNEDSTATSPTTNSMSTILDDKLYIDNQHAGM